ncbi:MAG: YggS family pyridoxal phosphate-dependent enzyme [Campylobacterota bacterium]|nr:YggS family pyridoxal phosphate-dependent enzyme [Campylobacterota bacterium]
METVAYKQHIDTIIENIEKARLHVSAHHIVKIVAVSKYSDSAAVQSLYEIGQRAFGENKVQDLKAKSESLDEFPLEWHFIGNLQKNKINQLLAIEPFLFQGLDTLELAEALQKRLETNNQTLDALLQINSANEVSKSGVKAEMADDIYAQIQETCTNIKLRGVMSIGAHSEDTKLIQKSFELTHSIFEGLAEADICSMGMSGDYSLAIKCGSNMVRLGSVMFAK